jgi:hypothetical protein
VPRWDTLIPERREKTVLTAHIGLVWAAGLVVLVLLGFWHLGRDILRHVVFFFLAGLTCAMVFPGLIARPAASVRGKIVPGAHDAIVRSSLSPGLVLALIILLVLIAAFLMFKPLFSGKKRKKKEKEEDEEEDPLQKYIRIRRGF